MCIIRNSTTVCIIIMSVQTRLDEWVKFRKNTYKFVYEYEKYGSKKLYMDRLGSYVQVPIFRRYYTIRER